MVERLLPAVWDEGVRVHGMEAANAPAPDMPKGYVNPAHGNNLPALLVDIDRGWRRAPLTDLERRAVFLRFAFDMKQVEVAHIESCTRQNITTRLFTAVGKIAAEMNGTTFREELEETSDRRDQVGTERGDRLQEDVLSQAP